jgi:chromosome segregation ATPase
VNKIIEKKDAEIARLQTAYQNLASGAKELNDINEHLRAELQNLKAYSEGRDTYILNIESQLDKANAILQDPKKWMMWCDNKYIDRYEEAEEQLETAKELLREWRGTQDMFCTQLCKETDNFLSCGVRGKGES